MTENRACEIIELLHKEVKPALGCTEPVAVALAVAKACETLIVVGESVDTLDVEVSANILKNGMGVGIPGTGMVGLHIASALAVTCGKSEYKLEVLKDLTPESVALAKEMVDAKRVNILLADTPIKLYIFAKAYNANKSVVASAVVQDNHDSIVSVKLNDRELLVNETADFVDSYSEVDGSNISGADHTSVDHTSVDHKTTRDYNLTVKEIVEFAQEVELSKIEFILDSVKLNEALANEGLKRDYGLKVGKTILSKDHKELFGNSFLTYAMAVTAAASDARMAGSTLPAMSNSGSGNQGITVTMPVIAYANKMKVSREELSRALIISHLVAIHIKGYLGKLSALCGCVIASTGSSCGIVFLQGGGYNQVCYAIKNMVGNITGMVCDGAKVGCALKVASGVSSSVQSAILALDNICISSNDGIIDDDIEKTISNLGIIGSKGMQSTDSMILDIMVCK